MLIDDDEISNFINRKLLARFDQQLRIREFLVAREALDYLQNPSNVLPDIILLDINMPQMNGWDFIREFSKLDLNGTKIIILTSSIDQRDEAKAQALHGVQGFFIKPLDAAKIGMILEF